MNLAPWTRAMPIKVAQLVKKLLKLFIEDFKFHWQRYGRQGLRLVTSSFTSGITHTAWVPDVRIKS